MFVTLRYEKDFMNIRQLGFFILLMFSLPVSAQQDFEYLGVLRIQDTLMISYQIMFSEEDGNISGYSITDLSGPHETKSYLSGYFDDEENTLEFYESGILYTKSPIVEADFCYVHFNGNLRKVNERQRIKGTFKGMYDNGDTCIDGEIVMDGYGKILKRAKRLDRKVDRSAFVSKEKKDQVDLVKTLDTLLMNQITANEVLRVYTPDPKVTVKFYDAGKEDNDRINLSVNGQSLFSDHEVTRKEETLELELGADGLMIQIEALNEGSSPPNTVRLEVIDNRNRMQTLTNLKKGQKAGLHILPSRN